MRHGRGSPSGGRPHGRADPGERGDRRAAGDGLPGPRLAGHRQLVGQARRVRHTTVGRRNAKPGAAEARVEAGFRDLVEALAGGSGVTLGSGRRGFGSDALLVNGHIFAMVSRGHLVLKLPRDRVAALLAEGVGAPFDAGKGTPMIQWLMLDARTEGGWLALADEAAGFVAQPPQ